ncbi:ABC transporter ATP-binding protein [Brachybacterium tyrofermentans]|uniref:ABC transporter ATP-binding protein n=1 Tax=Brachybacterium tyrofermentans TaxID=47848 RepID=UPI003FCF4C69
MIRTVLALLPEGSGRAVTAHVALTVLSVIARAVSAVLLVPLLGALFGPVPAAAWPWAGGIALATVIGWTVDHRIAQIGFDLGFGVLDHSQHDVADRLTRTRLTWFTAENTAQARQAIGATGPDLVGLIVYLMTPLLSAVLLPIAIALALLTVSWQLTAVALAGAPLMLGAYALAGTLSRRADRAVAQANSDLTERIVEFARTQHALRAARRVAPERSHVGAALERQHGATLRMLGMQVPGHLLFGIAGQIALLALAGTTVALTLQGTLDAPEAVALIVVGVRYLEPITVLGELSGGVESSIGVLRRIRNVLASPTDPLGPVHLEPAGPPQLTLRDVTFRYGPDDPPVLQHLDLDLAPGTTTAIVGPSGSGKSTVLSLLAGLHQPVAGSVLVDGVEASTLDGESRQRLSSVVFQHPYLFDGGLEENILVGDTDAPAERLHWAASLARVDEFAEQLADGWHGAVGEGGSMLSGGQRQRVSIARALLKPAPVLLVDEATSALDTENEAAITAALAEDPRARTRVIVAHRLASIRAADRVVFLENGRVVEDGGVEELLEAGGRFAEFWTQQDTSTGWRLTARSA